MSTLSTTSRNRVASSSRAKSPPTAGLGHAKTASTGRVLSDMWDAEEGPSDARGRKDGGRQSRAGRKVKTTPPFAINDPPSPPTSPRLPTTSLTLHPTISHPTHRSSSPSALSASSYSLDDDSAQPHWWTFTFPGRHRSHGGAGLATPGGKKWREPIGAVELRERGDGGDYFGVAPRKGSGLGQVEEEDGGLTSGGEGSRPASSAVRLAKAKLRAISRRTSTDDSRRPSSIAVANAVAGEEGAMSDGGVGGGRRRSAGMSRSASADVPGGNRASAGFVTLGPPFTGLAIDTASHNNSSPQLARQRTNPLHDSPSSTHPHTPISRALSPETPSRGNRFSNLKFSIPMPSPIFQHPTAPDPIQVFRPQAMAPPTTPQGDRGLHGFWRTGSTREEEEGANGGYAGGGRLESAWSRPFEEGLGEEGEDEEGNDSTAVGSGGGGSAGEKGRRLLGGLWGRAKVKKGDQGRNRVRMRDVSQGTRKQRLEKFLIFDGRVTVYMRVANLACVIVALALSITIRQLEIRLDMNGIIGASPVLTIVYASLTILHVLTAMYREYFGRPIGLWGLRSKMLWVCLDLLFIALWSSGLAISISDYLSTPLACTPWHPWWTSLPSLSLYPDTMLAQNKSSMCQRQAAMIAFIAVALVVYTSNMILSMFRIFERIRTVAKLHTEGHLNGGARMV